MTEIERSPTRQLAEDECWERLSRAPYGRIACGAAGEIDIFPINHRTDGRAIFFRTSAGTKLLELTIHSSIAFEIDGYDDLEAFSVVVKGTAEEFDRDADVLAAERLGVRPWAPEEKDRWVRIDASTVRGRVFDLATDSTP